MRTATPESQAWKRQLSQAQTNAANAKRYMLSRSLSLSPNSQILLLSQGFNFCQQSLRVR
jgi:hypothetical protein